MKRKIISAALALLMLLTAVGCGTTTTSSSSEEPPVYVPDAAPTQTVHEFIYDEDLGVHEFTAESSGYYLLEVWGAQGGGCTGTAKDVTYTRYGGKGGYSKGYVWINKGDTVYVCIGGKGGDYEEEDDETAFGGYNGGGNATKVGMKLNHIFGGGGGATHIATAYGNLENLKNQASSVLIVAGGGGGGRWQSNMKHEAAKFGNGGVGGGETGGVGQIRDVTIDISDSNNADYLSYVGTQTSGYAFGKGEDSKGGQAGGGGGWYGGKAGNSGTGAGNGGSGYIGNVELGEMESGIWEGNGKAVITWAGNTEDTIPEGLTIPTPKA
jgi:hypothetical protein